MATRWPIQTPYPSAPHSTPSSATTLKSLKPPIYNPYDKFTKPEFDQWIGGITSALRKALGQDEEEDEGEGEALNEAEDRAGTDAGQDDRDTFSDEFEDSFADIRSRQARGKGKARDPRDGPGLGVGGGGQENPIELLSDSDSEGGNGVSGSVGEESEEGEEDGGNGDEGHYDEEYEHYRAERGHAHHERLHEHRGRCAPHDHDQGREEEEETEETRAIFVSSREVSPEIIELSGDEEEEGDADADADDADAEEFYNHMMSGQRIQGDDMGYVTAGKYQHTHHAALEDQTPFDAEGEPQFEAQDEDIGFSPHHVFQPQPVELADPWEGPRTYAEDFYSGGDFGVDVDARLAPVSPSRLTPIHDGYSDERERGNNYMPVSALLPAHAPTVLPSHSTATAGVGANTNGAQRPEIVDLEFEGDNDNNHADDDRLPNSSPPPSSPSDDLERDVTVPLGAHADENQNSILDGLYDDVDDFHAQSQSQQHFPLVQASFNAFAGDITQFAEDASFAMASADPFEHPPAAQDDNTEPDHLDWNWPPAFSQGKVASRAGHLETPSPDRLADAEEDELEEDEADVSDIEGTGGPIPLGTSDLAYDELEDDERQRLEVVDDDDDELDGGGGGGVGDDGDDGDVDNGDADNDLVCEGISLPEGYIGGGTQPIREYDNTDVQRIFDLISGRAAQVQPAQPEGNVEEVESMPMISEQTQMAGDDEIPADVLDTVFGEARGPLAEQPDTQIAPQPWDLSPAEMAVDTSPLLTSEDHMVSSQQNDTSIPAENDEATLAETEEPSDPNNANTDHNDNDNQSYNLSYTVIEVQTDVEPSTRAPSQEVEIAFVEFNADEDANGPEHVYDYERGYEVTEPPITAVISEIVDTEDSATHQDDDDAVSQSQEIHSEAVDDLHQDAQADVVPPAADDHHVGGSDDHNAVDPGASENNAQPMSQPPVDDDMEASGIINTASSDVDNTTPPRPSTPRQQHPYPMPVSADPTVPDPIGSSFMSPKASQQSPPPKANHQTPPRLIKIPGTPHLVLSPSNTPGLPTPTPVAIPVTASMLEVLSRGVSVSATDVMGSGSGSGLFTPRNGEDASAASSASGNDNEAEQEKADDGLATGVNEGLNGSVGVAAAEEATDVPQHAVRSSPEPNILEEETPIEAEKGDEIVPDREDDEKIADRNRDVSPTPEGEEVLTKPSSIDEYAGIDKHPNVNDDNEPVESQDQITDAVEVEADNLPEDSTSVAQCIADAQPVEVAEDTIQASDNPQQEEAAEHISNQSTPQLGYPDDPPSPQGPLVVDDPLKLRVTTSTAASDLQSHNPILPASDDGPSNSPADIMQSFTNVPTSAETERRSLSVDPPREPSPAEDQSNDREFVVADLKPLKRKRVSSLAKPSRIPRSKSLNTAKTVSSLKSKSKGKGKADAHDQGDVHDSSHKDNNSEYGSTSSSASVASKLLIGPGSNASRASSVFSNAPSDSLSVGHAFTPPLFHAHGNLHHHHGHRPLPPPVPPRPQPIVRAASSPQPSPEEKEPAPAVTGTPSSSIRPVVSSNSPVTRSNCRFHKISLPKEEGGPRVCFVVPGCSLGDKTLMDDEEIQDHGPATYDDYARLLGNIESLDFNSYLIGVLRQLVGVDLLRENEVFYLLQPGEEFHYKKLGRKASAIAKRVTRESSSAMARSGSPVYSSVMRSPASSLRPPVSAGGSISTSIGSSRSRARASRTESHSLCSASDGETVAQDEDGTRKLKRRRKGSIAPESSTISAGASSSQQAPEKKATSSNRGLMRRRSKRLGKDNAAFQPDSGDGEDSADEEASPKSRRKSRQKNRGTKRPRVQENEGEVNSESQSKKRRNHDAEE